MDKPYFPFYPADWLSDPNVQFLSLEESGAYITLLSYMWRDGKDCALPDDDKYLARLLHVSTRKWAKLREILIDGEHAVFKKTSDGLIRNNRLDEEWVKANKVSKSRANAANARWSNENTDDANEVQVECKSNANASDLHMQNDAISLSLSLSDPELEKRSERDLARAEIVKAYTEVCGDLPEGQPPKDFDQLLESYDEDGFEARLVVTALHRSVEADHPGAYALSILKSWKRKGITTMQELAKEGTTRAGPRSGTSIGSNNQTKQRDERYAAFYELYPDA